MNQLQKLCTTYNLSPTVAVMKQTAKGVQISIEMDISQFENKAAGAVVLRQVAWGSDQEQAKVKAVKEILKHSSIKALTVSSTQPLFPTKGNKKKKQQKNDDGETWISASCFSTNPNKALALFEKFLAERGHLVEYKESGEYPKCEVECIVDGVVKGKGEAKGKWGAKKWAIKKAYFALKNEGKEKGKAETDDGEQKEAETLS